MVISKHASEWVLSKRETRVQTKVYSPRKVAVHTDVLHEQTIQNRFVFGCGQFYIELHFIFRLNLGDIFGIGELSRSLQRHFSTETYQVRNPNSEIQLLLDKFFSNATSNLEFLNQSGVDDHLGPVNRGEIVIGYAGNHNFKLAVIVYIV